MAYIDTNVIIAYCFQKNTNHLNVVRIMKKLRELGVEIFYCSPLNLVELYSYISRNVDVFEVSAELREFIRAREQKVRVIAEFCLSIVSRMLIPVFISDTKDVIDVTVMHGKPSVRIFHKFAKALKLVPELRIPTLDLLHLIYAKQVSEYIEYFATLDRVIISKAEVIEKVLGIKVIGI